LKHFTAVMLDRRCWTFNRASVNPLIRIGPVYRFIPPTPLLPVHLITCALLGVLFPVESAHSCLRPVFVSNPFTWLAAGRRLHLGGCKAVGVGI